MIQVLKFGHGTVDTDSATRHIDTIQGHKATEAESMLRFDGQVCHHPLNRIKDDTADHATDSIGAARIRPNR
jgi:hypothetical protein